MRAGINRTWVAIGMGTALVVLFLIFAVTQGIGRAGVPSGDVAVVEDTNVDAPAAGIQDGKISQEGFNRALEQAAKRQGLQKVPAPGDQQYTTLRDQALGDLLDIIWIEGEAQDRGITVSSREVDTLLQQTKKQSFKTEAEYQQFLKRSGFNQDDVDLRIRLQLLSQKIQKEIQDGASSASRDDAEKYYEANKSNYSQPEQRDVRVIVNTDQSKINAALQALQSDDSAANWQKVAAKYSTDPSSRNQGGLRKAVTAGALPQPVDSQVFAAAEGQLGGPVSTPNGSYIYEVTSIKPATTQPFDSVAAQIQQQLTGQLQQDDFNAFLGDYRDKWINLTICADGYVIERCDNFTAPVVECTAQQAKQTGCPPPVVSTSPAAPGTIRPFTPASGQPQRPHPAGEATAAPTTPGTLPGTIPGTTPGATPGATGATPPG
jgi:foldase protein PrsA